jgi:hypothetical protein
MIGVFWLLGGFLTGILIARASAIGKGPTLNVLFRLGGMMMIAALYCYKAELGISTGAGALMIEARTWRSCRRQRRLV